MPLGIRAAELLDEPWDAVWQEVWDAYDARTRPAVPRPGARPPARAGRRRGPARLLLAGSLGILLLAATAYAAAPARSAPGIAAAFHSADREAIAALVDWAALRDGATAPAPPATPAEAYLAGLARMVRQRTGTPEGLLALVQARIGLGSPRPAVEITGLGTARLTLSGAAGRGIAFGLELRDALPPRWMVVAVEPFD